MLKRFFNSPLFVGLLALGAVGVLYFNVVQPMIGGRVSNRVADSLAQLAGAVAETVPAITQVNPFDRTAVGWVDNPNRDPFLPGPPPEAVKGGGDDFPRAADLFSLAGTMIDPDARIASVNGKMVREGDRLNDYRIDRIEPGVVWLTGPRGPESITVVAATATATTQTR